jgi:hypothetical protein
VETAARQGFSGGGDGEGMGEVDCGEPGLLSVTLHARTSGY